VRNAGLIPAVRTAGINPAARQKMCLSLRWGQESTDFQ
jgi:hypothetical protein